MPTPFEIKLDRMQMFVIDPRRREMDLQMGDRFGDQRVEVLHRIRHLRVHGIRFGAGVCEGIAMPAFAAHNFVRDGCDGFSETQSASSATLTAPGPRSAKSSSRTAANCSIFAFATGSPAGLEIFIGST